MIRYTANEDSNELVKGIPSFSAVSSLLNDTTVTPTNIAFTRILPYPATDYDSIDTTMINFQDVLRQKEQSSGALWCDEGVYRIAKELQLLNSYMFDNIFIGLGGFHTEKILLACCGLYLKEIVVRDVFVYNEIYGPGVTGGTIMKGGDYMLCRQAMRNLAETVNRIRILKFIAKHEEEYRLLTTLVRDVSEELQSAPDEEILRGKWNFVRKFVNTNIFEKFQSFLREGEATSEI